jgi:transcriptional regulator with XRE-family HTH domain
MKAMKAMKAGSKSKMNSIDIAELMRLRNWSQADLARELGMSEATISRWLSGSRQPTSGTAILLQTWLSAAKDEPQKQPA